MSKRTNGEGSIYKTKDGKWRVAVSIGFGRGGKRIRRYRVCRSKADALAVLQELTQNAKTATVETELMTVGHALDRWLVETVANESAHNTHKSYETTARRHLKPIIGGIKLSKFSPLHVQSMLHEMSEKGIGDRTRQLSFSVLSACMEHLFRLGAIRENPCNRVTKPKYEREAIQPFTAAEVGEIIKGYEDTRWHLLLTLAVHTGMRQGELLGLHWEQIDFASQTIVVDRQAIEKKGVPEIARTKTKASVRRIEYGNEVADALVQHKRIMLRMGKVKCPLVFPTGTGNLVSKSYFITRCWNMIFPRAKNPKLRGDDRRFKEPVLHVPHRGFHHLRHTYATLALGAGVPVHVVSRILGHSSPSVTLNVYAHFLKSDQAAATGTMSRILAGGC